jgi:hypothetical protein
MEFADSARVRIRMVTPPELAAAVVNPLRE